MRAVRGRSITPLLVLMAGCATGFDRKAIRERLAGERVEVNDAEIQRALQL